MDTPKPNQPDDVQPFGDILNRQYGGKEQFSLHEAQVIFGLKSRQTSLQLGQPKPFSVGLSDFPKRQAADSAEGFDRILQKKLSLN